MIAGAVKACLPPRFKFDVGLQAPNTLLMPCVYACVDGDWSGADAWHYCTTSDSSSSISEWPPNAEVKAAKTPFALCLLIVVLHMVSATVSKAPDKPILLVVMWSLNAPLQACANFVRRTAPAMAREIHRRLKDEECPAYNNYDYWFSG